MFSRSLSSTVFFSFASFVALTRALPTYVTTGNNSSLLAHRETGYQSTAYLGNWAGFTPQDIPASKLTQVLYSFANISSNGIVFSSDSVADLQKRFPTDSESEVGDNVYGYVKQLYILKKKNRNLKVLLSIGGSTFSPAFPAAVSTDETRANFANSSVTLIKDWGFDGIDIDWEFPQNDEEATNYVLLLKAIREALDNYAAEYAHGYHFLLTAATPASTGPNSGNDLKLAEMDKYLDMWQLMAYDYSGPWNPKTGHQANLYPSTSNPDSTPFNTDLAVRNYVAAGVDISKILMGIPAYGRSFEQTSGLGETYVGGGTPDYKDLPRAGAVVSFDKDLVAAYSYDPVARELVSFESLVSLEAKVDYIHSKGLAGTMFWAIQSDSTDPNLSLIDGAANFLGSLAQKTNLLSYPASRYANIAAGMPNA